MGPRALDSRAMSNMLVSVALLGTRYKLTVDLFLASLCTYIYLFYFI